MNELKQFAEDLARRTGAMIAEERSRAGLDHSYKQGHELVTSADLKADRMICSAINERFPDHLILSEESSPDLENVQHSTRPVWIIDPIDGTVNYAHGHRQSAVSIAYSDRGQVKLGVVYNPFTEEMFVGVIGGGATLNGKPIRVAQETEMRRAIVATGFPYIKDPEVLDAMAARLRSVLGRCADIRRLGSAALDICWVAAGRLDAYYENLSLWDFAAARVIALEAGASCGHFSPVPEGVDPQYHNKDLLITNPSLFAPMQALLAASTQS